MIAHHAHADKDPVLAPLLAELLGHVRQAADRGTPVHEVEQALWTRVLALGRQALGLFFDLQGTGDLGDALRLPDGRAVQRLEQTHARTYRSVFGDFVLHRTAYGSREGQKISSVPLDARLQLPAGDYSYLLQRWDAALGCEFAFARVGTTLCDVLGLKQSTDSLERLNRRMAEQVGPFRRSRPLPKPWHEAEVLVVQADGKGGSCVGPPTGPRSRGTARRASRPTRSGWPWSVRSTPWVGSCGRPKKWSSPCSATPESGGRRGRGVPSQWASTCGPA
jgi:hypothetical protein